MVGSVTEKEFVDRGRFSVLNDVMSQPMENTDWFDDSRKRHRIYCILHSDTLFFVCDTCNTNINETHYEVCTGLNKMFREAGDARLRLLPKIDSAIENIKHLRLAIPLFKMNRADSLRWSYMILETHWESHDHTGHASLYAENQHEPDFIVAVADPLRTHFWALRNTVLQFLAAWYYTMNGCEGAYCEKTLFGHDRRRRKANPKSLETLREIYSIFMTSHCRDCNTTEDFGLNDVK